MASGISDSSIRPHAREWYHEQPREGREGAAARWETMLKLEHVALELLEYKVEEIRSRRSVRGGLSSVWELYRYLQRNSSLLAPDERRRLEITERALRRLNESDGSRRIEVAEFSDLVVGVEPPDAPDEGGSPASIPVAVAALSDADRAGVAAEQEILQRLAMKVWRHDLDKFVRRLAGGLRAERDRYTARLLFTTQRNLHLYCRSEESRGDEDLQRFRVVEGMPNHDDPFLSVNDVESLAELVRETIDTVLSLADAEGPFRSLGVRPGGELGAMRSAARATAGDPYAGRTGLLEQRGPSAQQLRVAIQELGKERMRDEERVNQRRQLEERLQRVLAFERNQRQLFHQDVARYQALVESFFERLARYLPATVGGEAGPARLTGGVLFAVNPALRRDAVDPHVSSVTVRLKGPTRLRLAGVEVAVSGAGDGKKLYLGGQEHRVSGDLAVSVQRKWLYAFCEDNYLHLKMEDEGRSVEVRVAEAAAVLRTISSPQRNELLSVLRVLSPGSAGEPPELVKAGLESIAGLIAQAPDRRAAVKGFLRGGARAAKVLLANETVEAVSASYEQALTPSPGELEPLLDSLGLSEVGVYTLTGEPLALEVATFNLTVRSYASGGPANKESLVVMLPGQPLGTFEEYLIEPLAGGLLVCVKGEQELVVGYLRPPEQAAG